MGKAFVVQELPGVESTMNVLGVILARAGSAGLKNKHLLPLKGKPVIDYTFEHARSARLLSRVVVSSDSADILRLAAIAGFETIARPAVLATAEASVQDVMLHAMEQVEIRDGFKADAMVVLYGNVPVRPAGAIDQAIRILGETGCDSVRSFCPVGKWHPAWMAKLAGDRVLPLQAGSIHRRQDLSPLFLHDGAAVAVSRESMLHGRAHPGNPHAFFGADRRGFQTAEGETVEIDQLRDLYWAEAVLRKAGPDEMRIAS
jgi:CMP-N-acetylneuraminic acid synthetase